MSNVQIDDTGVRNLFAELEEDKLRAIMTSALRKGAQTLKNNTIKSLRSKVNTSSSTTNGKPIENGVRMKVDKNYIEANVNIMGDYRLRFLEKGTQLRKTKSGANRGALSARNFFADARNNEMAVYDAIDKQLINLLKKQ